MGAGSQAMSFLVRPSGSRRRTTPPATIEAPISSSQLTCAPSLVMKIRTKTLPVSSRGCLYRSISITARAVGTP